MNGIYIVNGCAVGIFGMLLSAAFCEVYWTRKKKGIMLCCMAGILLLQGIGTMYFEPMTVRKWYPVITHLPLAMVALKATFR